MKRFLTMVLTLLMLVSTIPANISFASSQDSSQQITAKTDSSIKVSENNHYLVKFKNDNAKAKGKDKIEKKGGQIKKEFKKTKAVRAKIPSEALAELKNDPDVEAIEPDYEVSSLSETTPWGVEKVTAPVAHSQGIVGSGVNLAVFDTGISQHPDLRISGGVSFVDGTTSYNDDNGQGTHVSGILSSLINNDGIIGVAPSANIYAVKVLDSNGIGTYSSIIDGIEWTIDNNIKIINMSFAGKEYSQILEDEINLAYQNGILIFAAAGNSGMDSSDTIMYPAKYTNVIAVGATDQEDKRADFSSVGSKLELVAPGVGINSTFNNGSYAVMSGTSIAAPHAAGVADLVWSKNPSASNQTIRDLLDNSALDLGDTSLYGNGLVDVDNALQSFDSFVSSGSSSSSDSKDNGKNKDKKEKTTKKKKKLKGKPQDLPKQTVSSSVYDDFGNDMASATAIPLTGEGLTGESSSGKIDYAGDVDYFKFTPLFKGTYEIRSSGNGFDDYGELYDANGTLVASNDDSGGNMQFLITATLEGKNTYYLKVRALSSGGTGSYGTIKINAKTIPDEHGNDINSATVLPIWGEIPGNINYAGDVDYFKFTTEYRGYYEIISTGNGFDDYGELYDANGTMIASNDDSGGNMQFRIYQLLPAKTTYYLKVRALSSGGTDSYGKVKITFVPLDDEAGNDMNSAATIVELNNGIPGAINYSGDVDFFKFTTAESGNYSLRTTGSGFDDYVELYNSSGTMIASNDDSGGNMQFLITTTLTANTTYYLKVRPYSSGGTGSYGTVLISSPSGIADVYGNAISTARPIDTNALTYGSINPAGDIDFFSFTPSATGEYIIESIGSTDLIGNLYDSTQTKINSNDNIDSNNLNFRIAHYLTSGQTYYLEVKHASSTGTGAYIIKFSSLIDQGNDFSTAASIQVGTETPAWIDAPKDVDFFTFTPTADGTYSIETTGNTDTVAELYDINHSILAFSDDMVDSNAHMIVDLFAGQVYYAKVYHYYANGTGSYGFKVSQQYDDNTSSRTIQAGSPLTGTIDYPGDEDVFMLIPSETRTYTIETTGNTDTMGVLYDSNRVPIIDSDDDGTLLNFRFTQTLTANQTYYISVKHYSPTAYNQPYTLNIQ